MIRRIIFFLTVLVSTQSFSQRSSSSPYSIFGVGEEFGTRTVEQIGMGSIGAAYISNFQLNFINPASLSDLRLTTYVFGILNNDLKIDDGTTKQSASTTSLSYFSFAVPISPKMAFAAGMQPTSAVGYSFTNSLRDGNGDLLEISQFAGTGSVNRLYAGFGVKLLKNLSFGLEADFLFGNIENSVLNARSNVALASKNVEESDVRGGSVKLGFQYKKELKNNAYISVGAAFKLSNTLKSTGNEHLYSLEISSLGNETPKDTISSEAVRGRLERPLETIVGIGIGKTDKWHLGIDYKFQDALIPTGFLDNSAQSLRYGNSSRISIGGEYIPKFNSISNYWQRVRYRAGFKTEKTGQLVNGDTNGNLFTEIKDFGISFGLGLPLSKLNPTTVNFAFEYGKKGTTSNGLLKENYFNVRLSLSLNDLWFKKRQID